jgi:hypothetical protein
MIKKKTFSQTLPFYLFTVGVYLLIVYKDIFSNGMFLDGLIYSTVSKNIADGLGTFWNPHFTATCLADFHEHPPLAFGIQSLFYTFLGGSRFIDKLYSVLTVLVVGFIIHKIWKSLGYKYSWLPLFIWLLTPTIFWSSYNNLLENTLSVFTSLSVLFYLISQENKRYLFIILSGSVLAFGFLTKGFVAFFPWTFPFLWWIFLRNKSFGKMITDSAGIILFTLTPLLLIMMFPVARVSLLKYFDNQVLNSIQNVVTVNSRFDIVKRLISELAPAAGICIILYLWVKIRRSKMIFTAESVRKSLLFLLFGLTGVLPIMISMKQSGFYIVPAYPFFALGLSILIYSYVDSLMMHLNYKSKGFLIFKWMGYGLFCLGIMLSIVFSDHYSRDKNKIEDTYAIIKDIPRGTIINILPDMYEDWGLHAYYARFKNISLDPDLNNRRDFLLIKNESYSDTLNLNYEIVKLNTIDFKLYKMK